MTFLDWLIVITAWICISIATAVFWCVLKSKEPEIKDEIEVI